MLGINLVKEEKGFYVNVKIFVIMFKTLNIVIFFNKIYRSNKFHIKTLTSFFIVK